MIIGVDDFALWLGEEGTGAARLMRPAEDRDIGFFRVSRDINSARYDRPELLEPLPGAAD
ncbi:MAG: hypothetical protein ACE5FS_07965 [Paracoccaceae bacterium]